jgi:hypothetical protein
LSNGNTIALPNFPSDVNTLVETSAANGATRVMASQLKILAEALKSQGEIDQSQSEQLLKLANQGYRIAQFQQMIEDTAKEAPDFWTWRTQMMPFEGQMVNTSFFVEQLKAFEITEQNVNQSALLNSPDLSSSGDQLRSFVELYRQADQSGALKNPLVRDIVGSLSVDITKTSIYVANWAEFTHHNNYETQFLMDQIQHSAQQTNYQSSGICKTGGNTALTTSCI